MITIILSSIVVAIGLGLIIASRVEIGGPLIIFAIVFGFLMCGNLIPDTTQIYEPDMIFRSPEKTIVVYDNGNIIGSERVFIYNSENSNIKVKVRLNVYGSVIDSSIIVGDE